MNEDVICVACNEPYIYKCFETNHKIHTFEHCIAMSDTRIFRCGKHYGHKECIKSGGACTCRVFKIHQWVWDFNDERQALSIT